MDKLTEGARMRNPDIEIMPVSAKTGEGVQALAQRIIRAIKG
jgi:selenocysteine-specific translation elongation factor